MSKSAAVLLAAVFATASAFAYAEDTKRPQEQRAGRAPIQLTDAELDQITAGAFVTISVFPPNDSFRLMQRHDTSITIIGSGQGGGIFGTVTVINGSGVVSQTFPGH